MFLICTVLILHSSPRRLAGEKKITAIIIKQQFGFPISTIDQCAKNMTKVNWKFSLMKSSKKHFIFLPAFYLIMWLMISVTKEFKKNSHLENTTAGFLLKCQTSLRYEISLIYHWNIDSMKQDWSFVHAMVPKNDQNDI